MSPYGLRRREAAAAAAAAAMIAAASGRRAPSAEKRAGSPEKDAGQTPAAAAKPHRQRPTAHNDSRKEPGELILLITIAFRHVGHVGASALPTVQIVWSIVCERREPPHKGSLLPFMWKIVPQSIARALRVWISLRILLIINKAWLTLGRLLHCGLGPSRNSTSPQQCSA